MILLLVEAISLHSPVRNSYQAGHPKKDRLVGTHCPQTVLLSGGSQLLSERSPDF